MSDPRETLAALQDHVIDRRRFLAFTGALAGAAAFSQMRGDLGFASSAAQGYPFRLGVASGDPQPGGVLWTRLAPEPLADGRRHAAARRRRQLGGRQRRPASRTSWRRGTAAALPGAGALRARRRRAGSTRGGDYFYRFRAGDATEPGRPHAHRAGARRAASTALRFAFASCQTLRGRLFTAYRHMASEDLDLVVHLGDYIYEYGAGRQRRRDAAAARRSRRRSRWTTTGSGTRSTSPTRACRRRTPRVPWMVTWDDHEVDNDYAGRSTRRTDDPSTSS